MENWRDIIGYEGLYQVSDLGRVKSLNGRKARILHQYSNGVGYLQLKLCKDGVPKTHLVHRLVAEAFVPNPYGYKEVNHKDENKSNNVSSNLEYCDRIYNLTYGTRSVHKKSYASVVYQYSTSGELVRGYRSLKEIGRMKGYDPEYIRSNIYSGSTAYGYIWTHDLRTPKGRLF